ncbi:MAG: PorV/PorQ family protein, partial [Candidatus Marinimicrobia bacterium]|nr:PorV/PorQ family protein [Candidatus Neomarinimicrobiota bacterium]
VATADDATAMYWNPSGLALMRRPELLVNHTKWLADIDYTYMGLALPMGNAGTVGLAVTAMTMGEMQVTAYGVEGDFTGETFKAGSYAVSVSYARSLTDRFAIGGSAKIITETIEQASARGLAIDIGTLFRTPFKGVRLGVSMSNFGTKMQMSGDALLMRADIDPTQAGNNESVNAELSTDQFDLPLLMRVGLAKDIINSDFMRLTMAIDGMHPNDNTEYVNTGFEMTFRLLGGSAAVRGGLKSLFMADVGEKIALGGGLALPIAGGVQLYADYAMESWPHLNYVHKYSLRLAF